MAKMTLGDAVRKAYEKYKCLQNEDFYIEVTDTYVGLVWDNFMDRYINLDKVMCVARYLRRYTDLPIYSSYSKLSV